MTDTYKYTDKATGQRVEKQKLLVLFTLREVYEHFKELHPGVKVGFSKFCDLRPRQCALAGPSGSHSVCVCTIHQNVTLMMEGTKLAKLTKDMEIPLTDYKDCLAQLICDKNITNCRLGQCDDCGNSEKGKSGREAKFRSYLYKVFDKHKIENVSYTQWVSTDRSNVVTKQELADDFVV